MHNKKLTTTNDWIARSKSTPIKVAITAGASCPDSCVDDVIRKVAQFYPESLSWAEVIANKLA